MTICLILPICWCLTTRIASSRSISWKLRKLSEVFLSLENISCLSFFLLFIFFSSSFFAFLFVRSFRISPRYHRVLGRKICRVVQHDTDLSSRPDEAEMNIGCRDEVNNMVSRCEHSSKNLSVCLLLSKFYS